MLTVKIILLMIAYVVFVGMRVVLVDGRAHEVDSNVTSFEVAIINGIRQGVKADISPGPGTDQEPRSAVICRLSRHNYRGINKRNGIVSSTLVAQRSWKHHNLS